MQQMQDDAPPTTIFLVCNDRSLTNSEQSHRNWQNAELDDIGYQKAQEMAEMFARQGLARVISSPLRRAHDTASRISAAAGVPMEVNESLCERDYGPWSRMPYDRVRALFGSIDKAPDIEPFDKIVERVSNAISAIANNNPQSATLAIVGHLATNRAILASLFPSQFDSCWDIPQSAACWSQLECRGAYRWKLLATGVSGDGPVVHRADTRTKSANLTTVAKRRDSSSG